VVQRATPVSVSDESLHGKSNFFLSGGPFVCVVQKSKQPDNALKVYNSLSLLEMDTAAASGRSGGLAGGI
jgi:hypothetical protein